MKSHSIFSSSFCYCALVEISHLHPDRLHAFRENPQVPLGHEARTPGRAGMRTDLYTEPRIVTRAGDAGPWTSRSSDDDTQDITPRQHRPPGWSSPSTRDSLPADRSPVATRGTSRRGGREPPIRFHGDTVFFSPGRVTTSPFGRVTVCDPNSVMIPRGATENRAPGISVS